jgi:hypothetical protein
VYTKDRDEKQKNKTERERERERERRNENKRKEINPHEFLNLVPHPTIFFSSLLIPFHSYSKVLKPQSSSRTITP